MANDRSDFPKEVDVFQEYKDYVPEGVLEIDDSILIPDNPYESIWLTGIPTTDPTNLEIWSQKYAAGLLFTRVGTVEELAPDTYYVNWITGALAFHSSNYGQTVYASYTNIGTFWRAAHPNKMADAIEKLQIEVLSLNVSKTDVPLRVHVNGGRVTFGSYAFTVKGANIDLNDDRLTWIYVQESSTILVSEEIAQPYGQVIMLAKVFTAGGKVQNIQQLQAKFNHVGLDKLNLPLAMHTQIALAPRYPNAIEQDGDLGGDGDFTYEFTGHQPSTNQTHNVAHWVSHGMDAQYKEIVIRIKVPLNFKDWVDEDAVAIWAWAETSNTYYADFEVELRDTQGTIIELSDPPPRNHELWLEYPQSIK